MKGAIGILLIVSGFMVGYLVLIGKLPTGNTAVPQTGLIEQGPLASGGTSGGALTTGVGGGLMTTRGFKF